MNTTIHNPRRIAMWSGPRNISTAMMRAWGSRADTLVCDEPLYAHYLLVTGKDHPGAAEVIAHHETDWRKIVSWLTGPIPARASRPRNGCTAEHAHNAEREQESESDETPASPLGPSPIPLRALRELRGESTHASSTARAKSIFYQKHMAHHLLPEMNRGWLSHLTHGFLIRDPAAMLTSLIHQIPEPTLQDTGLPQQVEIFEMVRQRTGRIPPVVDSRDVLQNPRGMLERLCAALEVPFDEAMLSWPAGPRETDGIWAKHWYSSVEKSTTFEPYQPKTEPLPNRLADLHRQCVDLYAQLAAHRLSI